MFDDEKSYACSRFKCEKFLHSVSMGLAILCAPSEQKEGKQNRPRALSSNIESLYSFCFRAPMLLMRLTSVA